MENVINFINSFIEKEFNLLMSYYDIEIKNEDYNNLIIDFDIFFHPLLGDYKQNYQRDDRTFINLDKANKNKSKKIKRIFFQIKHYKNSTLGKQLSSHIDAKDIYRCYLGPNQKTTSPDSRFSRTFFVADTTDGLKIIYYELFTLGKWERPHDYDPMLIKEFGTLVEVKKFQAPEEPASLEDYNKE